MAALKHVLVLIEIPVVTCEPIAEGECCSLLTRVSQCLRGHDGETFGSEICSAVQVQVQGFSVENLARGYLTTFQVYLPHFA